MLKSRMVRMRYMLPLNLLPKKQMAHPARRRDEPLVLLLGDLNGVPAEDQSCLLPAFRLTECDCDRLFLRLPSGDLSLDVRADRLLATP